jgi:hypothetical protein
MSHFMIMLIMLAVLDVVKLLNSVATNRCCFIKILSQKWNINLLTREQHCRDMAGVTGRLVATLSNTVRSESRCALRNVGCDIKTAHCWPVDITSNTLYKCTVTFRTQICGKCLRLNLNGFRPV